jgi:hypothetical protein
MKQYLISTVIALLASAFATPSFAVEKKKVAAEKPAAKTAEPAKAAEKKEAATSRTLPYQGEVDAVDATAKTFTLKNKDGKEHVFAVGEKTQLLKADNTAATFDDIKVGEWVRGSRVKIADGKWDAVKVTIGKKEGTEKAKNGAAPVSAKPAEKKAE